VTSRGHFALQLDPDAVRKFEEESMILPQASAASASAAPQAVQPAGGTPMHVMSD
jgi:hypothetical protein